MPEDYRTQSVEETRQVGANLARRLRAGSCVGLIGDLGAGKTAFVRGLAEGLGCEVAMVSSPTYVLEQVYPMRTGGSLHHLDLYRMIDARTELAELGLEDMFADGVVVIEWSDRAADALPSPRIEVHLEIESPTRRRITIDDVP
jgi:tRNA threonylcarbamoyladenosine biosynthesis protein TsaE